MKRTKRIMAIMAIASMLAATPAYAVTPTISTNVSSVYAKVGTAITACKNYYTMNGFGIKTNYTPVIPPASEVYDPQNPAYGGRDYNY